MAAVKDKLKKKFQIICPDCDRVDTIGFLGGCASKRYFCSECCLEFVIRYNSIKFILVDEHGITIKEPDEGPFD